MFKFPFFAYKYNSLIIVIEASEREKFESESMKEDIAIHLVPIQDDLEILDILAMSDSKILVIRQLSHHPDVVEEKIIRHLLLKGAQVWDISPFDQSISLNTELAKHRKSLSRLFRDDQTPWESFSEFFKSISEIVGLFFLGPILLLLALFFELKGLMSHMYAKLRSSIINQSSKKTKSPSVIEKDKTKKISSGIDDFDDEFPI